ncbi:peptidoglycan-associated lipoprotein Pal [Geobacter sp. FeAm09]|uniref:peptidoglycan-associated lipoprotein Pal n=1 Tax=Geobacter sp. FeAm09 TaxID=2597769 RepID=UPI0011ECB56B|nr:peptidoglycan-associated lipoprotein Pal [Geobacter sp. FeAm09]QEM69415.1 peptidoglycan-associated lipoprotein Pal [Geobacter sp. FeAm09]
MKPVVGTALMACCVSVIMIAGCANKEVVKSDEPVVQKTEAAKPATSTTTKANAADAAQQAPQKAAEQKTANASQSAKATAQQTSFETIYFGFDQANLSQAARDVLSKNAAAILKTRSDAKIKIEGNCDDRGSAEYNLALGERRANAAQKYLETLGVPADKMSVVSYGKERPAVAGHDEAAWAKNRRDDFVIATP